MDQAPDLFSYRKHWAHKLGTAPELPMSRAEMDLLGWDACDVIIVTGDAYVDHPSFGMAIIGRLLEAQGFRVGIISQPDWTSAADFARLGRPTLFFGITAGNMDSMVNRYTSDRRLRSDDAYTPDAAAGRRPDRSVTVYAQRAREAFRDVPIIIGGIEASLRRIAHYDHWSEKVRRAALVDAKADLLIFGNAERAVVEVAHRLARGEPVASIRDVRGTGFMVREVPAGWTEIDSSAMDAPGRVEPHPDPYAAEPAGCETTTASAGDPAAAIPIRFHRRPRHLDRGRTLVRLPSFEQVRADPVLYAHASRVFHQETNPGNARALIQAHGDRAVWLNPPPIPLTSAEFDRVYELPYSRRPHAGYGAARHPGLGDDPLLGQHPARLFRRVHLLLHHRARGAHHPEPLGGLHPARDRGDPRPHPRLHRDHLRPGRPHRQHVAPGLQGPRHRVRLPQAVLRLPGRLPEPQHGPRAADRTLPQGAPGPRHQAGADRLRAALRPGGALARVHPGTGHPPCRRLSQDRPRAHRGRAALQDDEARYRHL